jgi:hypothetical protein
LLILLPGCIQTSETSNAFNPAAEGFDLAHSDPAAVELADSIMVAMGGWKNWDNTRFISGNFFGERNFVWDKKEERVRIESIKDSVTYLLDLKNSTGNVWVKDMEVTNDSLSILIDRGKNFWTNDSYWLVMPFKLKDTGITLRYLGEDTILSGDKCNVLELTKSGGATPIRYQVFVDLRDNLVKQWAYYANAVQDSASFIHPWDNYKTYGKILLSADRSDQSGPRNIKVSDTVDEKIFAELN